jgi:uncharacterized protein with PIN domain
MKFVVDAMLGKLALWLRLTGHDTEYSPTIEDDNALVIAKAEDRILLTSDEILYKRAVERDLGCMLVRGDVDQRISDVFIAYGISPEIDPSKARCSKCNGELTELRGDEKDKVKDLVYEQTFKHYDVLWHCSSCNSVFFQGGYWDNITAYSKHLAELMREKGKDM